MTGDGLPFSGERGGVGANDVEEGVEERRGFAFVPDGAELDGVGVGGDDADQLVVIGGVGFEHERDAVAGGNAADEAFARRRGGPEPGREAAEAAELGEEGAVAGRLLLVERHPGVVGEIGEIELLVAHARMRGGHDDHEARAENIERLELAEATEDVAHDEAEVSAAGAQRGELIGEAPVVEGDFHTRELAVKFGDDAGDELAAEAPVVADDELAAGAAGGIARGGDGDVDLREDLAGVGIERAARVGELHAPLALEERRAELVFERADLAAKRGLGDAQELGGAAEVEQFGDGFEVAKVAELHVARRKVEGGRAGAMGSGGWGMKI